MTRDYHIELDPSQGPPLLNVFGGKLTTYRKLSAEQPDLLGDALGNKQPAWTADTRPLPGGGEPNIEALQDDIRASRPWLPEALAWQATIRTRVTCSAMPMALPHRASILAVISIKPKSTISFGTSGQPEPKTYYGAVASLVYASFRRT